MPEKPLYAGPIEVYPEMCCEVCNEIVHNHMDCPVCEKKWAESNAFGDLYEDYQMDGLCRITCECGAIFEATENPYSDETIWRQVATANEESEA